MEQEIRPVAYSVHVGKSDYYFHPACLDEADRLNVNNLTPEQLEDARKFFTPIHLSELPAGDICMICHEPIIKEEKMNPLECIDGFHNQIGGYSCPNCHDQGCRMCLDASQLQD